MLKKRKIKKANVGDGSKCFLIYVWHVQRVICVYGAKIYSFVEWISCEKAREKKTSQIKRDREREREKNDDDDVAKGWCDAGKRTLQDGRSTQTRALEHLRVDWSKMNTTHCEGWRCAQCALLSFIQTIVHNWWMTQTRLCNTIREWMCSLLQSVASFFFLFLRFN